jgi:FkbH-like protein
MHWLPESSDFSVQLSSLNAAHSQETRWHDFVRLANSRLDFVQTNRLDRACRKAFPEVPRETTGKPVRLAVFSGSTTDHLVAALRVGCLRRGMWCEVQAGEYGQYMQELNEPESAFHAFGANVVLFSFDARTLLGQPDAAMDAAAADGLVEHTIDMLRGLWRRAAHSSGVHVIQQAILPIALPLIGNNEHRLPGSMRALIDRLNQRMRAAADEDGVDILALDARIAVDGLAAWHDPMLWHRAKQEISPAAGPFYGELVARLIAARRGRSYKCLVLDLDNTLWGGVIGDDGLAGIVIGQGSALGEAYASFQGYAKDLSRRGIILAVCSKNDEANAWEPFDQHPEMVLKRSDVACLVANWEDKASNLRRIAQALNIGLDALVFADDNPFERNIVRRELPMVAVPELPTDPALYGRCIADAGYFESIGITSEDRERTAQYQGNLQREALRSAATDLAGYLASLEMRLEWQPFDLIGLQRITQLINKTNQFNLTTRRYTDAEVSAAMQDKGVVTLQLRLTDRYGDNGIIGIVIARPREPGGGELFIDTWLMSCRVLGRQVEQATMNLLVARARDAGARTLIGEYRATAKNGMVREHYQKLGFTRIAEHEDERTTWRCITTEFTPFQTHIEPVRTGS